MKTYKVFTQSFGFIYVDMYSNKYNGLTIDKIETMPFDGWSMLDKKLYLDNCRSVIKIQLSGINLGMIQCLKNTNFNLVKNYLKK